MTAAETLHRWAGRDPDRPCECPDVDLNLSACPAYRAALADRAGPDYVTIEATEASAPSEQPWNTPITVTTRTDQ